MSLTEIIVIVLRQMLNVSRHLGGLGVRLKRYVSITVIEFYMQNEICKVAQLDLCLGNHFVLVMSTLLVSGLMKHSSSSHQNSVFETAPSSEYYLHP